MEDMMALMLPDSGDTGLNSTTMSAVGKPGLQIIPSELRNEIWRMLLTTSYALKEPTSEGDPEAHYEIQPTILQVSRQISNETRHILREENMWIFLSVDIEESIAGANDNIARLPVVSRSVLNGKKLLPRHAGSCVKCCSVRALFHGR